MSDRASLIRNMGSMIIWQIGNYVIALMTFPYLTRALSVHEFGTLSLSYAVAVYLTLVTDWGFNLSGPREVARLRDDSVAVNHVFWSIIAGKALLCTCALSLLAITAIIVPEVRAISGTLFAASGLAVANVFTVNWCLQGVERLGKFAVAATIGKALTVPATFLMVKHHDQAWLAALIQSAGAVFGGMLSIYFLRQLQIISAPSITISMVKARIKEAYPLFLSSIAINLYTTINTIALGLARSPTEVGFFGAADRIRAAAQGVISPISQAVYPRISRLMHNDREAGMRLAGRMLLIQGAATLCLSIVLFLCAPLIVSLLVGPKYQASVLLLRCISPIPFLAGISNVLGIQLLLPLGMKSSYSRILLGVAGINIFVVVPLSFYFGAIGTAIAAVSAEAVVVAGMTLVLRRAGGLPPLQIRQLFRISY